MSQSKVNQITESEELFTTQDLIESTPLTEETAIKAHDVNMSEDLDFQPSEDVSTEVNKAIEPSEDFDVEQSEDFDVEPTEDESITETEDLVAVSEDLGAMNEDSEQVQADSREGNESAKSKPAAKATSQVRISELPLSKIKHIIKLDPEVKLVNADAVFLITKATELFIRTLAKEAFSFAAQQKKKTITKPHVDQALTMLPIEL